MKCSEYSHASYLAHRPEVGDRKNFDASLSNETSNILPLVGWNILFFHVNDLKAGHQFSFLIKNSQNPCSTDGNSEKSKASILFTAWTGTNAVPIPFNSVKGERPVHG